MSLWANIRMYNLDLGFLFGQFHRIKFYTYDYDPRYLICELHVRFRLRLAFFLSYECSIVLAPWWLKEILIFHVEVKNFFTSLSISETTFSSTEFFPCTSFSKLIYARSCCKIVWDALQISQSEGNSPEFVSLLCLLVALSQGRFRLCISLCMGRQEIAFKYFPWCL